MSHRSRPRGSRKPAQLSPVNPVDPANDPLLSGSPLRREVRNRFGFQPDKQMIYRWIHRDGLPAQRFGKVWLVRRSDLIAFLEQRRQLSPSLRQQHGAAARARLLNDSKGGA